MMSEQDELNEMATLMLMDGVKGRYSEDVSEAIKIVMKYREEYITSITVMDHLTFVTLSAVKGNIEESGTVETRESGLNGKDPLAIAITKAYLLAKRSSLGGTPKEV